MGYIFEWDPEKADRNLRKHGVSFEEASTVWGDPLALVMPNIGHSGNEVRYLLLGSSRERRILVVAHTERGPRVRIISARQATRRERRSYEEQAY